MKELRLLGKQIMTLPLAECMKVGGIHLPNKREKKSDERPEKFEVLAIGPDVSEHIRPGDCIIAGKYAGKWHQFDGQSYYFISEDSDAIHAVYEPDAVEESQETVDLNDPAYQ